MQMKEIYLAGLTREEEDYLTPVPMSIEEASADAPEEVWLWH